MSATNLMFSYNNVTFWTRNTNCILSSANGYDTTGISVGIVPYGGIGGVLISNRHVLLARHTAAGTTSGSTIYFVNDSNTAFTYTITSVQPVGPSSGGGYTDIAIGYLNSTVDASLKYYKVFPSTFLNYLQLGATYSTFQYLNPYLPLFYMDQEKKFLCGDCDGIQYLDLCTSLPDPTSPKLSLVFSTDTERYNNSELIIGGDSGNIIFVPLNGEIVLLGTWYTGSPGIKAIGNGIGISSYICAHISAINSAMTTLAGTSYSLTQADLSGFNTYV